MNSENTTNMRIFFGAIGLLILFFIGLGYKLYTTDKAENNQKPKYAQKFEYNESEVNKLKRELDDQRLKSLKLQAKLDSCRYFIDDFKPVEIKNYTYPVTPIKTEYTYTPPKKSKPKVSYKAKYDSTLAVLNQKRLDCADLEINLNEQLVKKNRQLDTAVAVLNLYDKALVEASNKEVQLVNERDSLKTVTQTPISFDKSFPCLKAKRGVKVVGSVTPGLPTILIANKLDKTEYKAAKKSCKKANTR